MQKKDQSGSGQSNDSLKELARKERQKFPPVSEAEQRFLKEAWRLAKRQAVYGGRPINPVPPRPSIPTGGIAERAAQTRRPHPEDSAATRRSQPYWASCRKCEACPGPNRRRGKYPFGAGPNVGHTPDGEIT